MVTQGGTNPGRHDNVGARPFLEIKDIGTFGLQVSAHASELSIVRSNLIVLLYRAARIYEGKLRFEPVVSWYTGARTGTSV